MASKELACRVGCHDTVARESCADEDAWRRIWQRADKRQVVGHLRIVTAIHLGGRKCNICMHILRQEVQYMHAYPAKVIDGCVHTSIYLRQPHAIQTLHGMHGKLLGDSRSRLNHHAAG